MREQCTSSLGGSWVGTDQGGPDRLDGFVKPGSIPGDLDDCNILFRTVVHLLG